MKGPSPYKSSFPINEQSFVNFYQEHYSSFCFFANRYLKDTLEAEDIVSDVAMKVWEKLDSLQHREALKSYFYTSIRNACINHLRREKTKTSKEGSYRDSILPEPSSVLDNIIRTETLRELDAAIHSLPQQCRKVFIKLFVEGKSLSETAAEMQLSLSTIKNQRQRGIKLLREHFSITTLLLWVMMFIS